MHLRPRCITAAFTVFGPQVAIERVASPEQRELEDPMVTEVTIYESVDLAPSGPGVPDPSHPDSDRLEEDEALWPHRWRGWNEPVRTRYPCRRTKRAVHKSDALGDMGFYFRGILEISRDGLVLPVQDSFCESVPLSIGDTTSGLEY
ncbi:hypothetical protein C8Q77DRAFT_1157979 [Trametes polyzona]|nr:hypothetical protein C8Q77DRAFT_1157979 [Trametes polyzona]